MGLGPSICLDCMIMMDYDDSRYYCWYCPQRDIDNHHARAGHLFCLTTEQLALIDENEGSGYLADAVKHRRYQNSFSLWFKKLMYELKHLVLK